MLHRYKKKATTQVSGRFSKYKLSLKYNLIINIDYLVPKSEMALYQSLLLKVKLNTLR